MVSDFIQFMLWFQTFTTNWSGGRVQVWVLIWAPAGHLAISLKAVPEGNWRFRGQNQQPSSWGSSLALLVRDCLRRASTNRVLTRFWVFNQVFSSHLANYEILLQSGARPQIWGAGWSYLHKHWFLNKVQETEYREKGQLNFYAVTWQSISSD